MRTNVKPSSATAVIKWTDEEWSKIALWLAQHKDAAWLASDGLEDIKARDVFEAQDVLPAERHRKQISIAQGFHAIRTRLGSLFDQMRQQGHLFPGQSHDANNQVTGETDRPTPISVELPIPDLGSHPEPASQASAIAVQAENVPQTAIRESEKSEGDASGVGVNQAQRLADVPEKNQSGTRSETAKEEGSGPAPLFAEPAASKPLRPAIPASLPIDKAPAGQAPSSFIQLARPFVAMVCDELARALVRALAEQENAPAIASARPSGIPPSPSRSQAPGPWKDRARGQEGSKALARPKLSSEAPLPAVGEAFDEEENHAQEVQPLFDPKLPPLPNSDFKPVIGLVATHAQEYENLQLLYPQVRLVIVQADTIHDPDAFRDCQRILSVGGEVPATVDDLLKRTLRYRYVRLNGGVMGVREQLNTWLNNPASINRMPKPQVPRDDKQPNNQQGKKRSKWPPRVGR
jgi:hypothetical protein